MSTDLRQGDIIIFKAEDDWLSKAIAWITKSDVCHAAMVYSDNSIVEVGANGIGVHQISTWPGESVYVMRLSPKADPAPLIAAADQYLNAKTRYDFPALFLLAFLLIHNDIRPTARLIPAVNLILMNACLKLDAFIQHALQHQTTRAMVCSQLVYQIYQDCGKSYHISLSGSLLANQTLHTENSAGIRLADMATDNFASFDKKNILTTFSPVTEDILKELYLSLLESENTDLCPQNSLNETLSLTTDFLNKLKQFLEIAKSPLTLDSMFVAPCDFVYHADNLIRVTTLGLERVH